MDQVEPGTSAAGAVQHPHLMTVPAAAVNDAAAGTGEAPPGQLLDELARTLGPLTEEEAATVVVPVAQALGALHRAGLVHGAVDARHIVVRPDGMPVLVDLASTRGGSDQRTGDLRALIDCALRLLPGAELYAAAGLGPECLRAELLTLLDRPELDADQLVDACFRMVDPAPLRRPSPASEVRTPAGATQQEQGDPAGMAAGLLRSAATDGQRVRTRAPGGHHRADPSPRERRARTDRSTGRGWRESHARPGVPARRLGVAVAALLVLGVALVGSQRLPSAGPAPKATAGTAEFSPGAHVGTGVLSDPATAAADLSRLRAQLFADPATADLTDVEIVDGPAYLADGAVLASMVGVRNTGLQTRVDAASTVSIGADGTARVRLTATQSSYVRTGADATTSTVPGVGPRTVELELHWTDAGWRVWSVSEPTTP
ncbi:MAG: hypothetical protein KJ792_09915 [Actinobacteria bacterium]|nr:hypothetical protein [Actinomycetota bacterium]MCG2802240.1 hypothetical protein [Cellulomonas sp.]